MLSRTPYLKTNLRDLEDNDVLIFTELVAIFLRWVGRKTDFLINAYTWGRARPVHLGDGFQMGWWVSTRGSRARPAARPSLETVKARVLVVKDKSFICRAF